MSKNTKRKRKSDSETGEKTYKRMHQPDGEHWSFFERHLFEVPADLLQKRVKELIAFGKDPENLRLEDFWIAHNFHPDDFYRWIDKYPAYKEAYEFTKEAIGTRRAALCETGKMHPAFIPRLSMYSRRYKAWEEERKKEKENIAAIVQEKYIILPEAPKCDQVPEKKKK